MFRGSNFEMLIVCAFWGVVVFVLYILALMFGITNVVLGCVGIVWLIWWLFKPLNS